MSVSMEVQVGKIKITVSGETVEQAFQNAAVVSAFPVQGPNGEQDLQMRYRKGQTQTGTKYEYYSIVSESAGMEFKLGQRQDGGLFPKGWEPLYQADDASQGGTVGGTIGAAPQVGVQPQVQAPIQVQQPQVQPQAVAQPQAPVATPAAQQNTAQANAVLSKYGIGGAQ